MPKTIQIYTMNSCPFCEAAKVLLKQRGIEYGEIRLSERDDAAWEALYRKSGMKTVPQIFADGELVGGFQELAQQDKVDGLKSLKE